MMPVTGSTTHTVQQLPSTTTTSRMTHTARSASTVNSSGNSFEISPNVTQTPHVIPQVVHVYVASMYGRRRYCPSGV